jgi:hypothetical protein
MLTSTTANKIVILRLVGEPALRTFPLRWARFLATMLTSTTANKIVILRLVGEPALRTFPLRRHA